MNNPRRAVLPGDLRKLAEDLQRKADRYGELQGRLDRTSAEGSSPDGAVRVTVDSGGSPTAFVVTERFRALDAAAMSDALLSATRQAQTRLRDQVAELASDVVGPDGAADELVAKYRERFPDPPPQPDAAVEVLRFGNDADDAHDPGTAGEASPEPRRTRKDDGGDDDFGGSIYR